MSSLEDAFERSLRARRLARPVREAIFDDERQWRFDFAWPDARLAVEIEGGVFDQYRGLKNRHTGGAGYSEDCDKYNRAAELGWTVLRFTDTQIGSGDGAAQVERMLVERLGDAAYGEWGPEPGRPTRPARRRTERFGECEATEIARWRRG